MTIDMEIQHGLHRPPDQLRDQLRTWIRAHFDLDESANLINELGFVNRHSGSTIDSQFRADLALVSNQLIAYEIKSGADSLRRWPAQCAAYQRVFDATWLCVHASHLTEAYDITPQSVGLIVVDDLGGLVLFRAAEANPRVDPYDLSGFLWREDLDSLCRQHGIVGRTRQTKTQVRQRIAHDLPLAVIHASVLEKLKRRGMVEFAGLPNQCATKRSASLRARLQSKEQAET
ncbi:sce7726 family protein [Parachitinimonas caeni]|uniref:Sce7726 family protein n=1 Tax=Parachitinimonas caeni TaxID=3031301 RepID=A0ABT7E3T9_9NEIS|nr:sce7726 family protein [Parachitinimonas caeni]MDK2126975.1 sce7726 family protein [Parachitinimonas caeni]